MDTINQIANTAHRENKRFTDVVTDGYDDAPTTTEFSAFPLMRVFSEYLQRNPSEDPESVVENALARQGVDSLRDDDFLRFLEGQLDQPDNLFTR